MSIGKHILILCDAFGPPAFVPRVTSLARELQQLGWKVQVMSELMPHSTYQTNDFPLELMTYYANNKAKYAYQWVADKLWQAKERTFTSFIEHKTDVAQYDAILCSTFNVFPLLTASHLAKKYHKPLFVDLRDIAEQADASHYFQHKMPSWLSQLYIKRNIHLRNQVLHKAQAVTTVSPWHVAQLQTIQPNTHLIYNGFDTNDFQPQDIPTNTFTIAYTGKLYDFQLIGLQLFADALRLFMQQKEINKQDICVRIHTAKQWHQQVQTICDCNQLQTLDYIPRAELIQVLHESSILLVLTNKVSDKGPHGIMTTKFFEALGVEKPVLCVRSDEDCLAEAIQQTNAGIAATTVEETADFILEKYNEWKEKGYTHQEVRNKELFTRQNQAIQFDQLLRSIIE